MRYELQEELLLYGVVIHHRMEQYLRKKNQLTMYLQLGNY